MNHYELTMVLDPNIEEEGITNLLDKVASIVVKNNGEVIEADRWGLQKLAYPIRKQEKGHYILLRLQSDIALIGELEKSLKLTNEVLRFMFIRTETKEVACQKQGD